MADLAPSSPSHLLAQLEAFDSDDVSLDPLLRSQIHTAVTKVSYRLEKPATAMFRNTLGQATQSVALKVALDTNLFPALAEDGDKKDIQFLASRTAMDEVLLIRVLRCLASFGIVIEDVEGTYSLSLPCRMFGNAEYAAAADKCTDLTRQLFDALPQVIKDNEYRNPEDRLNGAVQKAFNAPGKEFFDVFKDMGMETVKALSTFLSASAEGLAKVYEVYPVQQRLREGFSSGTDEVFWVDVGGSFGQYTFDLKQKFGNLPGRYVVQDLTQVIDQAKIRSTDNTIEFEAHDFFETQPVQGEPLPAKRVEL